MGKLADLIPDTWHFDNFVETGCYRGEGLAVGQRIADRLYSCDISLQYVEKCRQLYPGADIRHADSVDFLTRVLPNLKGTTFFWLDAHYPHQYDDTLADGAATRFPPLVELCYIRELKPDYEHDYILIDDMRVVQSDDNPVRGKVGVDHLREYHLVTDRCFTDFVNVLQRTHYWNTVGIDTLMFVPRA